jgi:hypothetical protein
VYVTDDEGLEMPDAHAACHEAAAAEMTERLVQAGHDDLEVRVRDDAGKPTCEVKVTVAVTKH